MSISIAYMTCRRNPRIAWFLQSLAFQCSDRNQNIIIVDFYADEPGRRDEFDKLNIGGFQTTHVTPKPSVYQGKHRITQVNCFDASGARNTAICLCSDPWIAFVDDLSVLGPGWYSAAIQATKRVGYTYGSYQKVKDLVVENGAITGFTDHEHGHDTRRALIPSQDRAIPCPPDWLFGCSLVAPVETVLDSGGWPESLCAGMGYEDSCFGKIIRNRRDKSTFDPTMLTYESEEGHHVPDDVFRRSDPCKCHPCTNPRNDKSHAALAAVRRAKSINNGYSIRALRDIVLAGGEFPVPTWPVHDWFSGESLADIGK